MFDRSQPDRHATFYKAVFRPAVVRANRAAPASAALPAGVMFHSLRHPYASLCVAAGLDYMAVCRFMGHSKPTTTLAIYTQSVQHRRPRRRDGRPRGNGGDATPRG